MSERLHMEGIIDAIENYSECKKRGSLGHCSAHRVDYDTCEYEENVHIAKLRLCTALNDYIDERVALKLEERTE